MKKIFYIVIVFLFLGGCSHYNFHFQKDRQMSESQYKKIIYSHRKIDRKYEIPEELYTVQAVFLNEDVKYAQLEKNRFHFQWSEKEYNNKLRYENKSMKQKSKFFVSVFTPHYRDSRLGDKKNMWNVFFTYKSKRHKPKITSQGGSFEHLSFLYPHLDRWSRNYIFTIDIPTEQLEKDGFSVVFSNLRGQSILKFPPRSEKGK